MSTNRDKIKSQSLTWAALRVSTDSQAESGAGLAAQRASIETYALRQGLRIDRWVTDAGVSASLRPADRPGLSEALSALASARGGTLLVAKLDRIARRSSDLHQLLDQAERERWALISADGTVDMSTPYGRAMTGIAGVFAQLERDLIAQRTREALQAKREAGTRLGRPVTLAEPVRQRIAGERAAGHSMQAIADGLNQDRVLTATGRTRWYSASVASVLRSLGADAYAAERLAS